MPIRRRGQQTITPKLGTTRKFELRPAKSEFLLPGLDLFFGDALADWYKPIIYAGEFDEPPPEGNYYRVVYDKKSGEYCIQFFIFWMEQKCEIPGADHKYDYEPILVYIKPPRDRPVGVVNSGGFRPRPLGLDCGFHKTEIRRLEYLERDGTHSSVTFKTSPAPFYPFGGENGQTVARCIKKYLMSTDIYFDDLHPVFGIRECNHVFSGARDDIKPPRLSVALKHLTDDVLDEWYFNHNAPGEETFGHDVSNPFDFPYIKYLKPKLSPAATPP